MLNIVGQPTRGAFCDGMSRRGFIKVGGLIFGGLSLPELLRAEAAAGIRNSHKSCIMIFLPGGPPHQDMFDLKVDAPVDVRGEFSAINTNIEGIQVCEHFPELAKRMDKFAIIRSIVGATGDHYAFQCMTGRSHKNQPPGGWPSIGSWVSRLKGPVNPGVPPFVSLCYKCSHEPWGDPGQPGFLGVAHSPFRLIGGNSDEMVLQGITLERLKHRQELLASFDNFRREADTKGLMDGIDSFNQQAMGILTSSKLAGALDISQEKPETVARYGKGISRARDDGAPRMTENFLIARRLVEAGARVVTLNFSRWDWHGANFKQGREDMPMLDRAVTALVDDLHERGLDKDCSVVVWGEFGRTPKINKDAGRDHWPQVSCALVAGGGMKTGQVIGATNRLGEYAKQRPVKFGEVLATVYQNMGLLRGQERIFDLRGRPQGLVEDGIEPMRELI
jgi:hypothetical protein